MKLHSFGYLFGEGLRSIFRHKLMSFASIGVLTACLVLIGASVLLTVNINALVGGAEQENEIIAFLDDFEKEESEAKTAEIRALLEKIDNVDRIDYVSKEQALQEEKDRLGEDAALLDGFEENNPYPAHFVLTVRDLTTLSATLEEISSIPHIYRVNSAESVTNALISLRSTVQWISTAVFIALVLVSLVIISNTVRLTVFSRRREINIMKMVGATNSFIRMPFMVEGTMLGVFSGFLAFALLGGLYKWLMGSFDGMNFTIGSFDGLVPFADLSLPLLLGFLLAGMLAGMLGSVSSIQKHMKV